MLVSLQNSRVELLIPHAMVLQGRAFRRWFGPEAGALTSGTSALIKGTPESSHALFPPSEHTRRSQRSATWRGPSVDTKSWTSQPPALWEVTVCCLSPSPWYSLTAAWAKTVMNILPRHEHDRTVKLISKLWERLWNYKYNSNFLIKVTHLMIKAHLPISLCYINDVKCY